MSAPPPHSLGNGIHLVPAPLPFKSPPWVNAYAIETGDGLLLIDCGADWEPGRAALRDGLEMLGLEESAIHTLVVSHLHPDHVGMSKRLVDELGCRFVMHERAAKLVDRYNDTPGYIDRLSTIAREHGVPDPTKSIAMIGDRAEYMPVIDAPDHLVGDGARIDLGNGRALEVLHTPGHEPAHICLRDTLTGILFSGDHVLPRITPAIIYDLDIGDPLGDYMNSLRRLVGLRIGVTYPAHGTLIDNGEERARQILLHHDRRLRDMAELLTGDGSSAWEVMTQSFRPNLTPLESRLALLETVSHLEHLRIGGRVSMDDRDGAARYRSRRLA